MSDFDPGEGWREVVDEEIGHMAYPVVKYEIDDGEYRVWVREKPVPLLPTEPYTVIRVTCRARPRATGT